jgi:hypothetical protein
VSRGNGANSEFDTYAVIVARHLKRQGMRQASPDEIIDYAVLFNYGMAGSKTVSGTVPLYGQTGGGTSYQSGTASAFGSGGSAFGTYTGTTYTTPTYGVVGMMPYSYDEHSRFLLIRMVDMKRSTPGNIVAAWEAQVTSTGYSASFAPVAACLFDSAFEGFPRSGSKRVAKAREICGR